MMLPCSDDAEVSLPALLMIGRCSPSCRDTPLELSETSTQLFCVHLIEIKKNHNMLVGLHIPGLPLHDSAKMSGVMCYPFVQILTKINHWCSHSFMTMMFHLTDFHF